MNELVRGGGVLPTAYRALHVSNPSILTRFAQIRDDDTEPIIRKRLEVSIEAGRGGGT